MASIYKRGSTWWITYRIGGKNISHSLGTNNARIAEQLQQKYEGLHTNSLLPQPSRTPMGPFLQALAEHWLRNRSKKGAKNDISRLRTLFGQCCPALEIGRHTPRKFRKAPDPVAAVDPQPDRYLLVRKLEDLTPALISAYLKDRQEADDLDGKTINHLRGALSSMFSYAAEYHGYVCPDPKYKNPIEAVKRFPEGQKAIVWLKRNQIDQQLEALSDHPQLRAMVAVYIYAGLRRSEALWLTPDDVDLGEKLLRVQPKEVAGDGWRPKTGRSRIIPISVKLLAELQAFLPHRKPSVWFFSSPEGERWDADNFAAELREVNAAKGLGWSCAEFRHTFGSHLAQLGRSLYQISSLMGNSPDICRKHYAALLTNEMHGEVDF